MRRAFACILPAALLAAAPAQAEDPEPRAPPAPSATGTTATAPPPRKLSLELEYRRDASAAGCMDEKHFRGEVAQRLHRDPFEPDAVAVPFGRVTVVVVRSPRQWELKYLWKLDDHEITHGIFNRTGQQCVGLLEWAADRLVEHINDMEVDPTPPPPAVDLPPAPAPPSVRAPLPAALPPSIAKPAPTPPKRSVEVHGGVDMVFNPIVAPSVSVGFAPSVGVLLREPGVSIDLGLRAMSSVKATLASNGDAYGWTYASGVLAASIHKSFFAIGPLFEAGTLTPQADDRQVVGTLAPWFVAVGVRASVERSIADIFTLHVSIDGEYVPFRARFRDIVRTGHQLWAMPPFLPTVGAGVEVHVW